MVCGRPSSRISKSLRVRPRTGAPFEVTVTSTLTMRTSMVSETCAVRAVVQSTASTAMRGFIVTLSSEADCLRGDADGVRYLVVHAYHDAIRNAALDEQLTGLDEVSIRLGAVGCMGFAREVIAGDLAAAIIENADVEIDPGHGSIAGRDELQVLGGDRGVKGGEYAARMRGAAAGNDVD